MCYPVTSKRVNRELTVTDFLDEKRKEITDRLKELKPLVDEYNRLEAAAGALAGVGGSAVATARATRANAAPAGRAARPRKTRRKTGPQSARPGQTPRRAAQRQRHPRRRGADARAGPARHHDPRARRQDGDQAELPVPGPARARAGKKGPKKGRGWYPRLARGTVAQRQSERARSRSRR